MLLACGDPILAPFESNQNQYFSQVVPRTEASGGADWFRNTLDPYPFFTGFAKLIYNTMGVTGIRLFALIGAALALFAVYLLARSLTDRKADQTAVTALSVTLIGLTLLQHVWFHFAYGVANQFIISTPSYLQPNTAGCLLLLAVAIGFGARSAEPAARQRLLVLALVLAALACALHPTYMIGSLMLLAAAFAADDWRQQKARILPYTGAAVLVVAVAVLANPSLLAMTGTSPEYHWAVQRFAFERIGFHTLPSQWPSRDIFIALIPVAAIPVAARKLGQPWLARFLAAAVIIAVAATIAVQLSGEGKLALLFPWRVSVILVPVGATVLAVWIAGLIVQHRRWPWRPVALAVAAVAAVIGGSATLRDQPPARSDEKTALVHALHPHGVGLVPLESQDMRLNAGVAIYVEWKSPPYAGDDLVEWWHRIDQVRAFAADTAAYCTIKWHQPIAWILLANGQKTPPCVAQWKIAGQSAAWRVIAAPQ